MSTYKGVDELASRLISLWHLPGVSWMYEDKDGDKILLPTAAELETLLTTTFTTSLRKEEGRPVRLRWVLSLEETERGFVEFDEPRRMTVDELVRISPVVNSGMRRLVVGIGSNGPEIRGIEDAALHRETSQLLRQIGMIPFAEIETSIVSEGHIRVMSGFLSLDYDGERVRQKLSLVFTDFFLKLIGGIRENLILEEDESEKKAFVINVQTHSLLRFWERVLRRVQEMGHGGAFLFAPCSTEELHHFVSVKYSMTLTQVLDVVKEHALWGSVFADLRFRPAQEPPDDQEEGLYDASLSEYLLRERKLAHLVDIYAAFAAVDGAVLVNSQFELLGYGARISVRPQQANQTIKFVDWVDGEYKIHERRMDTLGMRHLSAAEFVSQTTEGIALVVSQDGTLRVFERDSETGSITCSECFEPFGTFVQEQHGRPASVAD